MIEECILYNQKCKILGGRNNNSLQFVDTCLRFDDLDNPSLVTNIRMTGVHIGSELLVVPQFITEVIISAEAIQSKNIKNLKVVHKDNKFKSVDCLFQNLKGVDSIDISEFDFTGVGRAEYFVYASDVKSIDFKDNKTFKPLNLSAMFQQAFKIQKLDLRNVDLQQCKDFKETFYGCDDLEEVLFDSSMDYSNGPAIMMTEMFESCLSLRYTNFGQCNFNVRQSASAFERCVRLEEIDVSGLRLAGDSELDVVLYKNTSSMFRGCRQIRKITLGNFLKSGVRKASNMFEDCVSLTDIDTENIKGLNFFDKFKSVHLSEMFQNCERLRDIDLSGFEKSAVLEMSGLFYNCESLERVQFSAIMRGVKSAECCFYKCQQIKDIHLRDTYALYQNKIQGSKIENIEFDSQKTNWKFAFCQCNSLVSVAIDTLDLYKHKNKDKNLELMFDGCSKLEIVKLPRQQLRQVSQDFGRNATFFMSLWQSIRSGQLKYIQFQDATFDIHNNVKMLRDLHWQVFGTD